MTWAIHGLALALALAMGEGAHPTPTPQPRSLSELAGQIKLEDAGLERRDGVLLISNASLAVLGGQGALTVAGGGADAIDTPRPVESDNPDGTQRSRWRQRYHKQAAVVSRLRDERRRLDHEIRRVWMKPSSRSRSLRLDRAQERMDQLDERLRRERAELDRIVREARRHGAQPGWFRGLGPG